MGENIYGEEKMVEQHERTKREIVIYKKSTYALYMIFLQRKFLFFIFHTDGIRRLYIRSGRC